MATLTKYDHLPQSITGDQGDATIGSIRILHELIPFLLSLLHCYGYVIRIINKHPISQNIMYPSIQNKIAPSDPPVVNKVSWTGCHDIAMI